jgi:hypothetical protein
MQKTIVLKYNGQEIVSKPFTALHCRIIDDTLYKDKNAYEIAAGKALSKMFEGTVITDEIINDLEHFTYKKLKTFQNKIIDWYIEALNDEEIKNS